MSSQPGAPDAPPPDGGEDDSRLHIRAITEMPAGHDAELATIFREMRRASGMSAQQMAARLATPIETIEALENGALLALPEWPELGRIVTTYATQLGLDSRPILRRLEGQLVANKRASAVASQAPPAPTAPSQAPASPPSTRAAGLPIPPSAKPSSPPSPPSPPPPPSRHSPLPQPPGAAAPHGSQPPPPPRSPQSQPQSQPIVSQPKPEADEKPKGRVAKLVKALLNWVFLIGFVVALGAGLWYSAKHPRMVWSALDTLPEPIPRIMRSAWNFMRPLDKEPVRPQISDPDNRKSDKLP